MKPPDVSFMALLSTFYSQGVECFVRSHPGRVVTEYQIAEIFGRAYLRASTPTNAMNVFRKTGIYPDNRNIFTKDMFSAAHSTDVPEEVHVHNDMEEVAETVSNPNKNDNVDEIHQEVLPETPPRPSGISEGKTPYKPKPSTSKGQEGVSSETLYFSPEIILPHPKVTKKPQQTSKKKKTGGTVVSTRTELKNSLEQKRSKEIEKRPIIKRKIGKTKNKKAVAKIEKDVHPSASEGDSNP
ncbi:hypothetical protein JTB14_023240 [Gonioctena quinquepunctata]|nr:hypothetical protein JTB14_023240 [Gonioctena quinquepunctata]